MTVVDTIRVTKAATRTDTGEVKASSAQSDWRVRHPARAVETNWPATFCDRDELDRLVGSAAAALASTQVREARRRGLPLLLNWLADQPGSSWQQRWLASGLTRPARTGRSIPRSGCVAVGSTPRTG